SVPSGLPVTVSARTTGAGTASGIGTAADYRPTVTNITFNPGETAKAFDVPLIDDTVHEPDETFEVAVSSADVTVARGTATGTITDDDPLPTLGINGVAKPEGNLGVTPFTFTVTLDDATVVEGTNVSPHNQAAFTVHLNPAVAKQVTLSYATRNGTALAGSDFSGADVGLITVPANQTTATINVTVEPDSLDEDNETFTVELSQPRNAVIDKGTATGTITDDDGPPSVSIGPAAVTLPDGNPGLSSPTLDVTL